MVTPPTSLPNSIISPSVTSPITSPGQQASAVNTPPVLVVGTNLDQVRGLKRAPSASFLPSWNENSYRPGFSAGSGSFAALHGYPEITVVIRFKRNNEGVGIRRDPLDEYSSPATQFTSLSNQNGFSTGNQGSLLFGRNSGGAAFECLAFAAFLSFDSLPVGKHAAYTYPLSVFVIFALNTTPNLGLFWYIGNPLFLALVIAMTTGALRPYNSISDFGCTLALLAHWRHIFPYFKNAFVLSVMMTVALILAPLFFLTWLLTSTSNANFYFSVSLIVGVVRVSTVIVQLLTQTISGYLRYEFHEKFGPNPRLSTGAKIVPSIRS
ncbi:hypothetical protein ACTXT7_015898 [Hymenolepis weldensis]